jgi:uncharacterized iron-regulated membrane protein
MSIRNIILKLHLWVGMAAALLILLLAASGTLLVYENEIDRLLNPKLLTVTPQPGHMPLQELVTRVRQSFGNQPVVNLGINPRPDLAWQVILGGKAIVFAYVNPHTGQVMGTRKRDASLMFKIHQFHTNLLVGKNGEKLVGYGTLCLAFLILTGLVLWWKRKMLTIQTAGSWRRINFDLHHISGIYSSLFLAVVVFTGLLISFPSALNPAVELFAGSTEREIPEEKPESQPQKGVPTINPDQALSIARGQLPGASPTFMGLPLGPKGVYGISFKFPEDRTPGGRSQVVLDRYTGGVLWRESSREQPRGVKFANMVRPLHTGDILGGPSRIVYAIASFSVVVQAITGVLIWVLRWRRKKRPNAGTEPAEGPL